MWLTGDSTSAGCCVQYNLSLVIALTKDSLRNSPSVQDLSVTQPLSNTSPDVYFPISCLAEVCQSNFVSLFRNAVLSFFITFISLEKDCNFKIYSELHTLKKKKKVEYTFTCQHSLAMRRLFLDYMSVGKSRSRSDPLIYFQADRNQPVQNGVCSLLAPVEPDAFNFLLFI